MNKDPEYRKASLNLAALALCMAAETGKKEKVQKAEKKLQKEAVLYAKAEALS